MVSHYSTIEIQIRDHTFYFFHNKTPFSINCLIAPEKKEDEEENKMYRTVDPTLRDLLQGLQRRPSSADLIHTLDFEEDSELCRTSHFSEAVLFQLLSDLDLYETIP
jgi:hypothetical protein